MMVPVYIYIIIKYTHTQNSSLFTYPPSLPSLSSISYVRIVPNPSIWFIKKKDKNLVYISMFHCTLFGCRLLCFQRNNPTRLAWPHRWRLNAQLVAAMCAAKLFATLLVFPTCAHSNLPIALPYLYIGRVVLPFWKVQIGSPFHAQYHN